MKTTRRLIILFLLVGFTPSHAGDRETEVRLVGQAFQINKSCGDRVVSHIERGLDAADARGGEAVGALFPELSVALRESGISKPRVQAFTEQVKVVLEWMKTQHGLSGYHDFLMTLSSTERQQMLVCITSYQCSLNFQAANHLWGHDLSQELVLFTPRPVPDLLPVSFAVNLLGFPAFIYAPDVMHDWASQAHYLKHGGHEQDPLFDRWVTSQFDPKAKPVRGDLHEGFGKLFLVGFQHRVIQQIFEGFHHRDLHSENRKMMNASAFAILKRFADPLVEEAIAAFKVDETNLIETTTTIEGQFWQTVARARAIQAAQN